ncbi:hypothetical protein BHM03_00017524 [Ensete ventricosum]|nr:hypothetical protein BHM03_00017524 [Ensete ventricosum]
MSQTVMALGLQELLRLLSELLLSQFLVSTGITDDRFWNEYEKTYRSNGCCDTVRRSAASFSGLYVAAASSTAVAAAASPTGDRCLARGREREPEDEKEFHQSLSLQMGRAVLSSSLVSLRPRIPAVSKPFLPNSTPNDALRFPSKISRGSRTRAAAVSESPTGRLFPRVAAESTGPIPAAELLKVVETAARTGAEVLAFSTSFYLFLGQLPFEVTALFCGVSCDLRS